MGREGVCGVPDIMSKEGVVPCRGIVVTISSDDRSVETRVTESPDDRLSIQGRLCRQIDTIGFQGGRRYHGDTTTNKRDDRDDFSTVMTERFREVGLEKIGVSLGSVIEKGHRLGSAGILQPLGSHSGLGIVPKAGEEDTGPRFDREARGGCSGCYKDFSTGACGSTCGTSEIGVT